MRERKTKKQTEMEWRRSKINELAVKGFNQADIARMLNVDKSAISRDLQYLKQQAKDTITSHIQERLPYEYNKCITGLEEIIKESWLIAAKAEKAGNDKERLASLGLIKDSYTAKMDLLTNANLLSDSVKWVDTQREKLIPNKTHSNKKKENNKDSDLEGLSETNNPATATESAVF